MVVPYVGAGGLIDEEAVSVGAGLGDGALREVGGAVRPEGGKGKGGEGLEGVVRPEGGNR